jgi:hypothetical protein
MAAPRLSLPPEPDRRQELASDGFMSVSAAVSFAGISKSELYRAMGDGRLAWTPWGRRRLVSRRSLTELLTARMSG